MSGVVRSIAQIAATAINPIAGVAFGMLFPPQPDQGTPTRTTDALRQGAEPGTPIKRVNGVYKIAGDFIDCGYDTISGAPAGLESELKTKKQGGIFGIGGVKVTTEKLYLTLAELLGEGPLYLEQIRLDDGGDAGEVVLYDRYNPDDPDMPDPIAQPDEWRAFLVSQFDGSAPYKPGAGIEFTPHYAPDGTLMSETSATLTLYAGTEWQEADPKLAAIHGNQVCPYVGLAYVIWNHYEVQSSNPTRTYVVRSLLDDKRAIIRQRLGECGVPRERMKIRSIEGRVTGSLTAQVEAPRELIEKIAAFDFHDLLFLDGGFQDASRINPATWILDASELGARFLGGEESSSDTPPPTDWTQKGARELPTLLRLQFTDQDADFEEGEAIATRQVAGHDNEQTINFPLVGRLPDMVRLVDVMMDELWAGDSSETIAILARKMGIAPGNVLVYDAGDGLGVRSLRVTKQPNIGVNGVMNNEGVLYDAGVFGKHRVVSLPTPPIRPTVATYVPPDYALLDLPALDGSTANAAALLFCATTSDSNAWSGADLEASPLDTTVVGGRSTIGTLSTSCPFTLAQSHVFNPSMTVRVQLISGDLQTAAQNDVANGANLLAVIGTNGTGLLSFCTATPVAGQANTYDLTNLWPGRFGTENVVLAAGAKCVLLVGADGQAAEAGNPVAVPLAQIGHSIALTVEAVRDAKAFTTGTVTPTGRSIRPLTVAFVAKSDDGAGGYYLEWMPRTRDWEGAQDYWQTGMRPRELDPRRFTVALKSGSATVNTRVVTFADSEVLPLRLRLTQSELTTIFGSVPTTLRGSIWHEGARLRGDETQFEV